MTSAFAPNPEWMSEATGEKPTLLDVWDGVPSLFLIPTHRGAILWWQFDESDDDSQYILLVHLNDQESQTVFRTKSGSPLTDVRTTLEDNRAIITRRHPRTGDERALLYGIPREFTDAQFFAWIDDIGEMLANGDPLPDPDTEFRERHWNLVTKATFERLGREMEMTADLDRLAASVSERRVS